MERLRCGLLIIGAGPGGYSCAIRAGQLGIDTIVVEAVKPGGTCLNIGCIPSKALIHAADEFYKARWFSATNELGISASSPTIDLSKTVSWKDGIVERLTGGVSGLLKKAKTRSISGRARLLDGKTAEVETNDGILHISTDNLVIATGSKPLELPVLPFGGAVISSTEALSLSEVPKSLSIVGGGYIGLEIGMAMAKLGASITVVEATDSILPQYDAQLTAPVVDRLKDLGVALHLNARAKGFSDDKSALLIESGGQEQSIFSDKVLVAAGRAPVLSGFGLETLDLSMNGPFLAVDAHCTTSMRGVYAIGDVTGDPMLAHRAMAQGVIVAEHVAGKRASWDKRAVPAVCFTDPEIVSVGELPKDNEGRQTISFPFPANGRALTMGRSDGFMRVVFDPASGLVTGLQAVGPGVSELAGELALAIEMAATLTDLADTIHAHPTLGEAIPEAALKALGRGLHI